MHIKSDEEIEDLVWSVCFVGALMIKQEGAEYARVWHDAAFEAVEKEFNADQVARVKESMKSKIIKRSNPELN